MTEKKKPRMIKADKLKTIYLNEWENEVETYGQNLFDDFDLILSRMEAFSLMLNEEEKAENFSFVFDAVVRDSRVQVNAMRDLVREEVGNITFHRPVWGQQGYFAEKPLGVAFEPA